MLCKEIIKCLHQEFEEFKDLSALKIVSNLKVPELRN